MATPNWNGATAGQSTLAGQINQFLGTHASTLAYTGTSQNAQTTAGSGGTNSNGLYLAQSFAASSTYAAARVALTLAVTGTPAPATISIQTNSGSAPSGTALASTALPPGFLSGSAASISIPLPASLVNATTYWIVINAVGDVSNFYTWSKSNQVSGASTSANGSTWAAQAYGFLYNVFSGNSGNLLHTYDDSGARWCTFAYNANGTISSLSEYAVAQNSSYQQSVRTFNYSGTLLTSIT